MREAITEYNETLDHERIVCSPIAQTPANNIASAKTPRSKNAHKSIADAQTVISSDKSLDLATDNQHSVIYFDQIKSQQNQIKLPYSRAFTLLSICALIISGSIVFSMLIWTLRHRTGFSNIHRYLLTFRVKHG